MLYGKLQENERFVRLCLSDAFVFAVETLNLKSLKHESLNSLLR